MVTLNSPAAQTASAVAHLPTCGRALYRGDYKGNKLYFEKCGPIIAAQVGGSALLLLNYQFPP
jgi:hypothetical protein